ncbi:hypothetical protein HDU97_008178, partial [Phlyctochytrium planicorne]
SPGSDTDVAKSALSVTDPKTPSPASPPHLSIGTPKVLSRQRRTTANSINTALTTSTPRPTSTSAIKKAMARDSKTPSPASPPHLSIGNPKVLSRQRRTTANSINTVSSTSTPRHTSPVATKKAIAMASTTRQLASPGKTIMTSRIGMVFFDGTPNSLTAEAPPANMPNIKVFGKERAARFQECAVKGLGPDPKAWEVSHSFRFGRGDDGCLYGIIANNAGELRRPPVRLSLGPWMT